MKMKRWIRRIVPIVSAVLLMFSTGIIAYADGDIRGSGSLTIDVHDNDGGISGAKFAIYQVQRWTSPGTNQDLEWSGSFADFGNQNIGSLRGQTASAQKAAAESLSAYINANDDISPNRTGSTGKNGLVAFSGLEPGVYLVVVTDQPNGYTVTSPFLVFVPEINAKTGEAKYDVSVEAKVEAVPVPTPTSTPAPSTTPEPTTPPTPGPSNPPTPGPSNPPTPRPTNPPEPGPSNPPTPGPTDPPSVPTPPATPTPAAPTAPPTNPPQQIGNSPSPSPVPTPDQGVLGMRRKRGWEKGVLGKRRLPQTGTLQWPIPVLAVAGILLFFIGWTRKYGKKNKTEEKNAKKRKGMLLMSVGPLMIIGGMGILLYNNWDNDRAAKAAQEVLVQIEQNAERSEKAKTGVALAEAEEEIDTTMSTIEVDGFAYIGEVAIPAIDISLPVMNSVTSEGLKIAPGRYEGNYKENSLIIAAHNYQRHFGNIKYLSPGDQVVFLDVDGTEYFYEVAQIETVGGTKVADMSEGDWDLTLFTCTYGGKNRVTVRCNLQEA